jgi:fructose-1-phosphate kinase PfkB-like protein
MKSIVTLTVNPAIDVAASVPNVFPITSCAAESGSAMPATAQQTN